jgi:hypothetical protein
MKKIYIIFLFSICLSTLFGQVTLTFRNNGPVPGDSSRTHEITYVDPGNPGENQVWNFSGIQYTGKINVFGIKEGHSLKITETDEKSLILADDGYDYTYLSGENGYSETGYVNSAKNLSLNYSDPVIRMNYPFSFGQQFRDPFTGVAWFGGTNRTDLSGEYTVTADAFGTLILPECILKNAMRVRTVKQSLQISACGSVQSTIVKYSWFAPGYRYPVLMLSTVESVRGGKEPVVEKTGWINLDQPASGAFASAVDPRTQVETGANTVIVFPNPFAEQVTYNYFLRKQLPVAVELYDMSGKINIRIEQKQLQAEGLHTGTINAALLGMSPGVYYLRFLFDKEVVIRKIVKI